MLLLLRTQYVQVVKDSLSLIFLGLACGQPKTNPYRDMVTFDSFMAGHLLPDE